MTYTYSRLALRKAISSSVSKPSTIAISMSKHHSAGGKGWIYDFSRHSIPSSLNFIITVLLMLIIEMDIIYFNPFIMSNVRTAALRSPLLLLLFLSMSVYSKKRCPGRWPSSRDDAWSAKGIR